MILTPLPPNPIFGGIFSPPPPHTHIIYVRSLSENELKQGGHFENKKSHKLQLVYTKSVHT